MAQGQNSEMSLLGHFEELRARVFRGGIVFLLGFLFCFFVTNSWMMSFLREPLLSALPPEHQRLIFTHPFESFFMHLKVGAISALCFLSPYFFYEVWGFVSPGLYGKERRIVIPFLMGGTVFFILGAAFAYFVVFPTAFPYLLTYDQENHTPLLKVGEYYPTALKLLLLFGLAFELPVVIVLLGFLGVIDARLMRKHRSNAIIGITVVCALMAPPDAISMILMMIPMMLMYEGSIFVVQALGARRQGREKWATPEERAETAQGKWEIRPAEGAVEKKGKNKRKKKPRSKLK